MNGNIVATIFSIGGQVISYIIKNQPIKVSRPVIEAPEPVHQAPPAENKENPAVGIKAGCVPCSLGHLGTCKGMLDEAVRFAQAEGLGADIPVDRINTCLDELNALERKDLTPQQIDTLKGWERDLAVEALKTSRELRHGLEGIKNVDDLVHVAAETSRRRAEIGREWFKRKVAPEE
jgi:hypothetical protein